jgi:predicted HicB family RNase H-like nuclease
MATMEYEGYVGVVEVDDEANILHGHIINTRDVITFQGRTVKEMRKALKESVDDYLEFCKVRGVEPDRPYSGKFMVRIDPELHRELAIAAAGQSKSIQAVVREAIQLRIASGGSEPVDVPPMFELYVAGQTVGRGKAHPRRAVAERRVAKGAPAARKRGV